MNENLSDIQAKAVYLLKELIAIPSFSKEEAMTASCIEIFLSSFNIESEKLLNNVWCTYKDYGKIYCNDPEWMLTNKKLALTNNARVMHCLPVRRNVELSDEILDGANSLVTQEASNRVWAAQAVLSEILNSPIP